jgi:hypothetical protein
MWWFDKGKRKDIWDEEIQWPIGDIEAAHKIRDICRAAAVSAEKKGGIAEGQDKKNNDKKNNDNKNSDNQDSYNQDSYNQDSGRNKNEADRYERAARVAMEIAIRISDDLLRDSAVRQIVDLCVKAGDLRTARILFRALQTPSIKAEVLNDHPVFRQ